MAKDARTSIDSGRLTRLFTSEFGAPLRGNRVLSVVEIVAAITSILAFGGSVSSLFGAGPVWSTMLVIWLLVLTTGLVILVVLQERRVARRVRYAIASAASHGAEHRVRDAEAGILNSDATTSETLPVLRDALAEVARTFTLITGYPCRACVKEVHYPEGSATAVPATSARALRDLRVSPLCRDGAGGPPSPADEKEHFVSDNTDFEVLFLKRWRHRWFMSNDLTREESYKNSSWVDDRPRDYRSTCVWPIQKTDDKTDDGLHDTLGFLCVDSLDPDIFDERFDFHVGAAMADSLYPLLKLMRLRADGMSFLSAANGATDGTPKDAVQEEEL